MPCFAKYEDNNIIIIVMFVFLDNDFAISQQSIESYFSVYLQKYFCLDMFADISLCNSCSRKYLTV